VVASKGGGFMRGREGYFGGTVEEWKKRKAIAKLPPGLGG